MKYLTKFKTRAEYELVKNTLVRPNVSFIESENECAYMKKDVGVIEVTFDVSFTLKGPSNEEDKYLIRTMFSGETFCEDEPVTNVGDVTRGKTEEKKETPKWIQDITSKKNRGNGNCIRVYPSEWFEKIEIDGVELPIVTTTAEVTLGTHVIRYILKKDAGKDIPFGYDEPFVNYFMGKTVPPLFLFETEIRGGDFSSLIKNISFSDDIIGIAPQAFFGCSSFANIDISNIEWIGRESFISCTGLTSIEFSKNISVLESSAFAACGNLQEVIFPKTLKNSEFGPEFGNYIFNNCAQLYEVELPKNLGGNVPPGMFNGCNNLNSVILPDDLYSFDDESFNNTNLLYITVPYNGGGVNINSQAFGNLDQSVILDLQANAYSGIINEEAFAGTYDIKIHVPDGSVNDFVNSGNGWDRYYIYSDNGEHYDPNLQEEK